MKHWIEAARLRTLPLSVSGIIVGSIYALSNPTETINTPTEVFSWKIFGFALLTTLGLQVLSNFANDYGDGVKGTDNAKAHGQATIKMAVTISGIRLGSTKAQPIELITAIINSMTIK